jgi:hypothetical protein
MDWITGFTAMIPTVLLVLTLGVYAFQWHAMVQSTRLQALLAILKYFEDSELKRTRDFMYQHGEALRRLFNEPFSWNDKDVIDAEIKKTSGGSLGISDVDLGLNGLNNVCYLIRKGYASQDVVDGFLRNSLLHAWNAYEGYIAYRRRRIDVPWPSVYAQHLEWVVKRIPVTPDTRPATRPSVVE